VSEITENAFRMVLDDTTVRLEAGDVPVQRGTAHNSRRR